LDGDDCRTLEFLLLLLALGLLLDLKGGPLSPSSSPPIINPILSFGSGEASCDSLRLIFDAGDRMILEFLLLLALGLPLVLEWGLSPSSTSSIIIPIISLGSGGPSSDSLRFGFDDGDLMALDFLLL